MSFLDEEVVTTANPDQAEKLAKRGVKVNLVDKVSEKKGRDLDGDGDIDSDDYLAARNRAIKKAMGKKAMGKEVEEGKLSKALGGVAVLTTLLGLNKANSEKLYNGDPKIKSLTSQYENAKEKGDKTAMAKFEKEIKNRKSQIDTGKIDEADLGTKIGDALFGKSYDRPFSNLIDDIKSQLKLDSSVSDKESNLLIQKIADIEKGDLPENEFNNITRKLKKAGMSEKELKNLTNRYKTAKAKKEKIKEAKTVELPADTTFTLDLKHLMKKHLDEGKSQKDVVKLTKALMKKLHDKGEVTVKGTKVLFKETQRQPITVNGKSYTALDLGRLKRTDPKEFDKIMNVYKNSLKKIDSKEFDDMDDVSFEEGKKKSGYMGYTEMAEADIPQDTQLTLPEPPARDYLGDDGKDYEGGMAKSQMLKMKKYAMALCDMVDDETQLEAWVQAKITKASDYMSAVYHYLDYQNSKMNEETLNEETFNFPQADQYTLRKSKWGGEDGVGLDMPSSSKFREKDTNYILLKDTPFDNIDDLYNAFKEKLSNPKYNNDVFKRFANQTNGMILQNVKLDE